MYAWLEFLAAYFAPWALILALVALAWCLVLWRRLRRLEARYAELTAGTDGGSFEEVLNGHLANVQAAAEKAHAAWQTATRVQRDSRNHLQHIALLRYNPFEHTGGDQSFVLALADAEGNGAVVNSLHARDGTRMYAKPLAAWQSSYPLTGEELEAIDRARSRHSHPPVESNESASAPATPAETAPPKPATS